MDLEGSDSNCHMMEGKSLKKCPGKEMVSAVEKQALKAGRSLVFITGQHHLVI